MSVQRFGVVAVIAAFGCAGSGAPPVKTAPDGTLHVECKGSIGACHAKAAGRCADGYRVIKTDGRHRTIVQQMPSVGVATGKSYVATFFKGSLTFACATQSPATWYAESPPPTGGEGYAFGSSREDAEKICTESGGTWLGDDVAHCTTTAADRPGLVTLHYCGPELCQIAYQAEKPSAQSWRSVFAAEREAVSARHGQPTSLLAAPPEACTAVAPACIGPEDPAPGVAWAWRGGQRVSLTLAHVSQTQSALVVQYTRDARPDPAPARH